MSPHDDPRDDRDVPMDLLDAVLADHALEGLTRSGSPALERALAEHGAHDLELAAAALDLALYLPREELPRPLRARLVRAARDQGTVPDRPRAPRAAPVAWAVAAAALVVALFAWMPHRTPDPNAARAALAARADALHRPWQPTERAAGASGDVVWSPDLQQGFARLAGLAPNDPTREQYQLWIFDSAQEHPIDGGVFDVTGAEALVPITAKLRVAQPTLFAVTLEKPGGVVVSDQQRIVLVAQL